MAALGAAAYRFAAFLVDRAGYRVLEGDRPIDLTPKLLDLLLHLLDNAGELVTKEDLLDALWPGANVTDNALTQAVSDLRQALGDDAAAPRFIKTVARRGYRFVAPVETVHPAPVAQTVAAPDDEGSVAVLDFTNVTGDEDAAWLSAGIAETVSADLRALDRFRVVDRWRVTEAVRRTSGAIHEVAAALQVRLVVVGSFQCSAGRLRITARVVDVVSGDALADAKVDGRLDDVFDLQDQVAEQFAQELGAAPAAAGGRHSRETASLEAYRAVMEGWLRVETLDVRELPKAIADFERAVAIDPKYALAYTGLATAEFASYESTRADIPPSKALLDRAIAHGRQAAQLDDSLAEAHGALALILVSAWETPAAIREARRAVALEPANWRHLFRLGHATWGDDRLRAGDATLALYPDFAFAYFQSAMVHVARGHLTEAERVLRHGAAIQDRQIGRGERYPALGLHWLLGLVRLALDDVKEAIEEFDREADLALPHRLYGREYTLHAAVARGAALLRAGERDEAAASFRRGIQEYPDHPLPHAGLALATGAETGWTRADSGVASLAGTRPLDAALMQGVLAASRGGVAAAAATLRKALDEAPPGFAGWWLPVDPLLRQVIDTEELQAVMARLAERAS
jgi:DNA-binding winged helix-turn-helix (wHTH) protein/Tfp pilus assembly protein PilF